jgi:hypothetical protein
MIIIDLNQVMVSNLMMQLGNHTDAKIEEGLVRHMVLNAIRSYKQKFGEEYGEIVIACDDKNYWRRKIYPYYKANRKKAREESDIDWTSIFECFNKIRDELKEYFPYRVLKIDTAEADDIIGTLVYQYGSYLVGHDTTKILIMSGDKDFIQLQKFANVKQYDPVRKKFISHKNPELYLKEHIMRGDAGDGVPNFLSPDDVFVTKGRQKPIRQTNLDKWVNQSPETFSDIELIGDIMVRGYKRNENLIDLSKIPSDIYNMVIAQFDEQKDKKRGDLLNYFIKFKLKNLMPQIGEF